MNINRLPVVPLVAAGAVLAALAYRQISAGKRNDQSWVGYMAEQTGAAVVDAVDGALSGAVYAVGDKVGIPRTEKSRGELAWERGDYLEASFYLPAGDFLSKVWHNGSD